MSSDSKRVTLNRGSTPEGFADIVYHLHNRQEDDHDVAKEYEALTLSLWKKYEHNRDGYTDAKHEFIYKQTEKAKRLYKNRY